ncbi:MAG: nuclear transport factor 2 family protein [Pseudomonadota bacterium]
MDGYVKLQIQEMLARSAFALDHKDLPGIAATFHEDARFTLEIAGVEEASVFNGKQEIMGLMQGALEAQTDVRRHVMSNFWYKQTGENAATVVSYLSLFATENGLTRLITTGIYTDAVASADVDGGWLITDRLLQLDNPY